MKNRKFIFFSMAVLAGIFFASCDDDNGSGPSDPQELITTVRLTFDDGNGTVVFTASDPDGDGGNSPVIDDIVLKPLTTYQVSVEFLDESDPSTIEDLTEEVKDESTAHLVCMTVTGDLAAPVSTDLDTEGAPLGLLHSWETLSAGTGTLKVVLKHEPDKLVIAPCSTGETDAEVVFNVKVE